MSSLATNKIAGSIVDIDSVGAATAAATTALSLEHALRSAVILTVFVLLLCTSVANIVVLWCRFNDVISIYLIGLSMADLFCALCIIPFSLYSSLRPGWAFAGDTSVFCKCTVYAHMVLLASTVFTFAWISVDRYAAFMKPSRYEAVHTVTRCKCWILFSWATSLLLACPVLIAKMETHYSAHLELCFLNYSSTLAYSTTVGLLVLLPSICTVLLTCCFVCSAYNNEDELEDLQRNILTTDPNFAISIFICVSFVLSWLPVILFQFLPRFLSISLDQADADVMNFAFTWLAIGGGSSKLLIYSFTSKQFRHAFCFCFMPRSGHNTSASPLSEFDANGPIGNLLANSVPIVNCTTTITTTGSNQMPPPPSAELVNHRPYQEHKMPQQQQQQQQPYNARSPIAYSFLSTVDYGSFGLGPTGGGFVVRQQQQQQNHLVPASPQHQHRRQHEGEEQEQQQNRHGHGQVQHKHQQQQRHTHSSKHQHHYPKHHPQQQHHHNDDYEQQQQ